MIDQAISRKNLKSILRDAIKNDKIKTVKSLVENGYLTRSDIAAKDFKLFSLACTSGALENVKYLISRFDITRDEILMYNCRSMRWAAENDRMDVVRYISRVYKITGADVIMMYTTFYMKKESVKCLVELNLVSKNKYQ